MSKETKLKKIQEQMVQDLVELMQMEKERETLESEVDKKQGAESTRKGMLEALTEVYFAKIIKIAKEEEEIDQLSH